MFVWAAPVACVPFLIWLTAGIGNLRRPPRTSPAGRVHPGGEFRRPAGHRLNGPPPGMFEKTHSKTIATTTRPTAVQTQLMPAQAEQVAPALRTLFHQVMWSSQHIVPHDVQARLAGLPHA